MRRLLIAVVFFALLFHPIPHQTSKPTRLVLVYLNADNNLFSYGFSDLQEMTEANRDTNYAKVIVLFDGANIGDTKLYEVEPGGYHEISAYRVPSEANMGDPQTLRSFITRAIKTYSPQYVFVDLRDHGGARSGLMRDDSNNDHMTVQELKEAIEGLPITILGFDACLMGNLETLYELSTVYHGLVIASTLTEPGDGRDYHRLNVFSSEATPYDVGKAVVDYYYSYYQNKGITDVTLALYDLAAIDYVAKAANDLGKLLTLEALSNFVKYGTFLGAQLLKEIDDSLAGDGTAQVHIGTNSTARKAYQVYLEANKTYYIELDRDTSADLDLYVFEPGSPIDPNNAFAYSRYNQPESVTFTAPVSGNRTIAVDHYSSETTPTKYQLKIFEVKHSIVNPLLSADVYGPLKNASVILPTEYIIRHAKPHDAISITAGNVADLGMSLGDYSNLAFAKAAPMRYQFVKLLTLGSVPDISVSYSLENATIAGVNTVISVTRSSDTDLQLRLYNLYTHERLNVSGDLSDVPMFPYAAYLVHVNDSQIDRALKIGEGYFGGRPVLLVNSSIGSSGNVTISGLASVDYPIEAYLNGSYIGNVTPSDGIRSLAVSGFGELQLEYLNETYNVTIFPDSESPNVTISYTSGRFANVSISVSDESLAKVEVYLDGKEIPLLAFSISSLFARNVTVIAYDTAGHEAKITRIIEYSLSEHPLLNKAPMLNVTYTLDNTSLRLNVYVEDDDGVITLELYVNGTLQNSIEVSSGMHRTFSVELSYGSTNVTIVAVDPYNATASRSHVFTINPPQPSQPSTSTNASTSSNSLLLRIAVAVIAIVVILTIVMLLRRR